MSQYVGDLSYDQCLQQAKTKNQKYFGLQYAVNPPVAQCFLSNDLNSTTKYGKASNCRNINSVQYGMAWSNAVYNVEPDVNYDQFCEINKVNQKRRSFSQFLVSLSLNGFFIIIFFFISSLFK
jgi:hypothetical protein